jgi:hypothetical protein
MTPVLTLLKVRDDGNIYGWDRIHILHFNFDGNGAALVRYDDEQDLNRLEPGDLECILFGRAQIVDGCEDIVRHYQPAPNLRSSRG